MAPRVPKDPGCLVDFKTATVGRGNVNQLGRLNKIAAETPGRLNFVSSPRRTRHPALAMEVQQDDVDHNGKKERNQISGQKEPRVYMSDGEELWIAMSWWLPAGFYYPVGEEYAVLLDGVPNTPTLSQSAKAAVLELSLGESGGQTKFRMNVQGGVSADAGATYPHNVDKDIVIASREVWHDFLYRYVMSQTASGLVECWHSEVALADAKGVQPTFTEAPQAKDTGTTTPTVSEVVDVVYPQFGYYRKTHAEPGTLYFGGASIQATREMACALWRS